MQGPNIVHYISASTFSEDSKNIFSSIVQMLGFFEISSLNSSFIKVSSQI